MLNETQQPFKLVTPLFSTDYAQVNREISEWNRRARPSFLSIQNQINALQAEIDNVSDGVPGLATPTTYGSVRINQTSVAPVVYIKSAVDLIVAGIQSQITSLQSQINFILSQEIPLLTLPNPGDDPNNMGIVGKIGVFGQQRIVNLGDGNVWFWAGPVYKWLPG